MKIVDTHVHAWDPGKLDMPWLDTSPELNRAFMIDQYGDDMERHGIVSAVYMEVDVGAGSREAELEFARTLVESNENPVTAAVLGGCPGEDGFDQWMHSLADLPWVKGIRHILHSDSSPPGACLESRFVDGVGKMGECKLVFDLCQRPGELLDGASLARSCPETTIVVDHCGRAQFQVDADPKWRKGVRELGSLENTVMKISGIGELAGDADLSLQSMAPWFEHMLDCFGSERLVFGSNWPVDRETRTGLAWIDWILELVGREGAQVVDSIFHDNAITVYGL
ncbi:MAG: hypothetical protein CMJ32_05595 [Phycisphaerae bacterium]|nr:hypothetical protein [Phycisphaerae bacterium]